MRIRRPRFWKCFLIFLVSWIVFLLVLINFVQYNENKTDPITKVNKYINCFNKSNEFKIQQRGNYWVLTNYVAANRWFACDESITITTIGDPSLLDNLIPLAERWNGPISVTLYTPGSDMAAALRIIKHLRACYPLVAEYVSFHLFFEAEFRPSIIPTKETVQKILTNSELCTIYTLWQKMNTTLVSYRKKQRLRYPINVARNIARDAAVTHFIFASDIELRPSENFIPYFLDMFNQNHEFFQVTTPCVFVVPVFQLNKDVPMPATKNDLLSLISSQVVDIFHHNYCDVCHTIPGYTTWLQAFNKYSGLRVIYSVKRGKHGKWEPFYVGTNQEPYFDERLDWEGRCNKAIQGYTMCVLDYNYHILDNAFAVHKFKLKQNYEGEFYRNSFAKWTLPRIRLEVEPDIHALYGTNEICARLENC